MSAHFPHSIVTSLPSLHRQGRSGKLFIWLRTLTFYACNEVQFATIHRKIDSRSFRFAQLAFVLQHSTSLCASEGERKRASGISILKTWNKMEPSFPQASTASCLFSAHLLPLVWHRDREGVTCNPFRSIVAHDTGLRFATTTRTIPVYPFHPATETVYGADTTTSATDRKTWFGTRVVCSTPRALDGVKIGFNKIKLNIITISFSAPSSPSFSGTIWVGWHAGWVETGPSLCGVAGW